MGYVVIFIELRTKIQRKSDALIDFEKFYESPTLQFFSYCQYVVQ